MFRRLLLCVLVGSVLIGSVLIAAETENTVFMDKDLSWEEGPPDLKYQVAFGSLTVFRKSGELVQIICELIRDEPSGPILINLKSGFAVFAGSWGSAGGDKIRISRQIVAREKILLPIGKTEALPGPTIREVWLLHGGKAPSSASSISTLAGEVVRVPLLWDPGDVDKLVQRFMRRSEGP